MDREDKFFVLSLLSLAVSLFLFPLALYLLPQAWLGWVYHMPDFITAFSEYVQLSWGVSEDGALWVVVSILFFWGVIFSFIAYYAARQVRVDHKKKVPHESVNEAGVRLKQAKQNRRAILSSLVKLAVIIFMVFVISDIMQWAMAVAT